MSVTQTPRLTVLTVNTHKGFAFLNRRFILHKLREAIRSVSADIVFLQEVLGTHKGYSARFVDWPDGPHYEFLADTLWPQFAYGRNAVYPHGHHGNALLSKFPILRHRNRDISIGDKDEKRGLLHCVLHLPQHGVELHAVCVHLSLSERHRAQQIDLLCALIDADVPTSAPLVVAGDFNDWRRHGHQLLRRRCVGLKEAFADTRGRFARTFPARWPLLPLDRIYVRNLRIAAAAVLSHRPWSRLSDHAALSAELHA